VSGAPGQTIAARLRDLPIRRKLLLMTFASSAVALLFASGGFLAWDVYQFRIEMQQDMETQARVIAETAAPAVEFNDERTTSETVAILRFRPRVELGCVYTKTGTLFALFARDAGGRCPVAPPETTRITWDSFSVVTPLNSGNDTVGSLFVRRDLDDLYARVRVGVGTVFGLLLVALAVAFLVAARLQRAIASPLLELADVAGRVSMQRDYTLRGTVSSSDEVGVVVRAFNNMLDAIAERTTELSRTNRELAHEIEERRKVEAERTAALARERDANRLKDEFLATLSHELRTPLNAVLGWTRVLRAAPGDQSAATRDRALLSIERNARAQARLIEDLLEVSRIVTGKLRLQTQDVDLATTVESAVEVVQPAAAAKRITLAVEIESRPAWTAGDPDRLQQVVWNLLSNAVKFTPADGRVTVRLERHDDYRLTVRDTGAGIDAAFLPFVVEPFRQADGTASREHGGLGLGLAIAKQIVELHGGTIQAHSAGRQTGATFEVRLPSVVTRTPAPSPVSALPLPTAGPVVAAQGLLHDVTVMVVDDEEDARALMQTALSTYGADVVAVGSAAEALAELDRRVPDVIVSDIGMPHADGYAMIREVRARAASRGGSVPAIAVTAYASQNDRTAAETAGYQAHIAKPFEPSEVAALVAHLAGIANE
jgi:signal transduction histidine kinase/ActR/RegA family two-component response regulator